MKNGEKLSRLELLLTNLPKIVEQRTKFPDQQPHILFCGKYFFFDNEDDPEAWMEALYTLLVWGENGELNCNDRSISHTEIN